MDAAHDAEIIFTADGEAPCEARLETTRGEGIASTGALVLTWEGFLQRLVPGHDAQRLVTPLKQRAMRLLKELDAARVNEGSSVDQQIANEVKSRLAEAGGSQ